MNAACREVLESEKLVALLELILAMGNFMNFGPFKALSVGFHVSFLPRVR